MIVTGSQNDFIYIDDVLDAFARGVERNELAGIFNLGSGRGTTVLEVAREVEKLIRKDARFSDELAQQCRNEDVNSGIIADISRAKAALGWEPKMSLAEGIRNTWRLSA